MHIDQMPWCRFFPRGGGWEDLFFRSLRQLRGAVRATLGFKRNGREAIVAGVDFLSFGFRLS